MSSFQGVGIEVSSFQGVGIECFQCIQMGGGLEYRGALEVGGYNRGGFYCKHSGHCIVLHCGVQRIPVLYGQKELQYTTHPISHPKGGNVK